MRTRIFAMTLGLASCARPPGTYEEPPPTREGSNEQLAVEVVQDFGLGERALADLMSDNSLFLVGELSPRLNPLRGMGTLVVIATPTGAKWFLRPLVARTDWNLYPASVTYTELYVRAFVRWTLVAGENSVEANAESITTPGAAGELPATVQVRTPKIRTEAKGDVYAYLFVLE